MEREELYGREGVTIKSQIVWSAIHGDTYFCLSGGQGPKINSIIPLYHLFNSVNTPLNILVFLFLSFFSVVSNNYGNLLGQHFN